MKPRAVVRLRRGPRLPAWIAAASATLILGCANDPSLSAAGGTSSGAGAGGQAGAGGAAACTARFDADAPTWAACFDQPATQLAIGRGRGAVMLVDHTAVLFDASAPVGAPVLTPDPKPVVPDILDEQLTFVAPSGDLLVTRQYEKEPSDAPNIHVGKLERFDDAGHKQWSTSTDDAYLLSTVVEGDGAALAQSVKGRACEIAVFDATGARIAETALSPLAVDAASVGCNGPLFLGPSGDVWASAAVDGASYVSRLAPSGEARWTTKLDAASVVLRGVDAQGSAVVSSTPADDRGAIELSRFDPSGAVTVTRRFELGDEFAVAAYPTVAPDGVVRFAANLTDATIGSIKVHNDGAALTLLTLDPSLEPIAAGALPGAVVVDTTTDFARVVLPGGGEIVMVPITRSTFGGVRVDNPEQDLTLLWLDASLAPTRAVPIGGTHLFGARLALEQDGAGVVAVASSTAGVGDSVAARFAARP